MVTTTAQPTVCEVLGKLRADCSAVYPIMHAFANRLRFRCKLGASRLFLPIEQQR